METYNGESDGSGSSSQLNPAFAHRVSAASAVARPGGNDVTAPVLAAPVPGLTVGALLKAKDKLKKRVAQAQSYEFATPLEAPGIPVRELMTQVFVFERGRSAKEFFWYFVYVLIFVAVVFQLTNMNTVNMTNSALRNLLVDEEIPTGNFSDNDAAPYSLYFKKTFNDIGDYNELRQWLRYVLVDQIYAFNFTETVQDVNTTSVNTTSANATTSRGVRYLIGGKYFALKGGIRLWQVRVSNTSCSAMQIALREAGMSYYSRPNVQECYGEWEPGLQETTAYGVGKIDGVTRTGIYPWNPYVVYPKSRNVFAFGNYGWGQPYYGTSGFSAFLPASNASKAEAIMNQLVRDDEGGWIDAQTRMVIVDFSVYNYDTGFFTTVRLQVETPPTGYFMPNYEFFTYRATLYLTLVDKIRGVGEVLLVVSCFSYMMQALGRIARRRKCSDRRALFELLVQILVFACIVFWLQVMLPILAPDSTLTEDKPQMFGTSCKKAKTYVGVNVSYGEPECWVDMYPIAQDYKYAITFAGCVGLLMALKFFMYFSIYHSLSLLWITLARAGKQLLAFCFGFSLLVSGFAFMGQMCFGHIVAGFHTWPSAFSTLLRYPLGDFNYADISGARPEVAGIFFALYMALVFLVCINMVVAIITITFEEVTHAAKADEKWKHAGRPFVGEVTFTARLCYLLAAREVYASRCCRGRRSSQGGAGLSSPGANSRAAVSTASTSYGGDSRSSTSGGAGGIEIATVNAFTGVAPSRDSVRSAGSGSARGGSASSIISGASSSSVSAAGSSSGGGSEDSWWGSQELGLLCAEAYYHELMSVFIETAEYMTRQDLMRYSEEVYLSSESGVNHYIGLDELCEMTRDPRAEEVRKFCANHHTPPPGGEEDDAGWGTSRATRRRASLVTRTASPQRTIRRQQSSRVDFKGGESEGFCGGTACGRFFTCDTFADCCGWKGRYLSQIDFRVGQRSHRGWGRWAGQMARGLWWRHIIGPIYRRLIESGLPSASLRRDAEDACTKGRCIAFRLEQAYKATRRVTMLGRTQKHTFMSQWKAGDTDSRQRGDWHVLKYGPLRTAKHRKLTIVEEQLGHFVLYNNEGSTERRLRRRLLLTQVVQIDASTFDPRRLVLYIEARDPGVATAVRGASAPAAPPGYPLAPQHDPFSRFDVPADARYDLVFEDAGKRDSFVEVLVQCRTAMQAALAARLTAAAARAKMGGLGGSGGGDRGSIDDDAASGSGAPSGMDAGLRLMEVRSAATTSSTATSGSGVRFSGLMGRLQQQQQQQQAGSQLAPAPAPVSAAGTGLFKPSIASVGGSQRSMGSSGSNPGAAAAAAAAGVGLGFGDDLRAISPGSDRRHALMSGLLPALSTREQYTPVRAPVNSGTSALLGGGAPLVAISASSPASASTPVSAMRGGLAGRLAAAASAAKAHEQAQAAAAASGFGPGRPAESPPPPPVGGSGIQPFSTRNMG